MRLAALSQFSIQESALVWRKENINYITMEIRLKLFILWIYLILNVNSSKRKIKTSKCRYTFVVNEMDTKNCPNALPQLQADKVVETPVSANTNYQNPFFRLPQSTSVENNEEVLTWLNNMEKQLLEQLHKTVEINSTISKHETTLNKAEQMLGTYESNFTAIFRMLRYLEESLREQHEVSRNLDNKLSGIMLDVVEVNNVLSKKVPASGTELLDKAIQVQSVSQVHTCSDSPEVVKFKDCMDVQKRHKTSGVYFITPTYAACPIPVWCDMDTTDGGWTLLLRRKNGETSFKRLWNEYKHGFGNVVSEFYLGNDNMFLLSNQDYYELRVDLWDFEGNRVYALYKSFKIEGERDNYRINVHSFEGSARDALKKHNRAMFSTADRDHDGYDGYNCAKEWEAGWWFQNCWFAFLTGPYYNVSNVRYRGISWNEWKHEQLAKVEMKIRPSRTHSHTVRSGTNTTTP